MGVNERYNSLRSEHHNKPYEKQKTATETARVLQSHQIFNLERPARQDTNSLR